MCTEKSIEELMINAKELDFAKFYFEKQMKIVDAVNTSQCEPIGMSLGIYSQVAVKNVDGRFKAGEVHAVNGFGTSHAWSYVCTIEEYLNCIEEMKYHYDIPKWCSYSRADKELLTVENSDYSFYRKETFVYGQDVYLNSGRYKCKELKFGCYHPDGVNCLLTFTDGYAIAKVSSVSATPFKTKEELEIEAAKKLQVYSLKKEYWDDFYGNTDLIDFLRLMQENGDLAGILLPLEPKQ